jgi:hypothetical protein
MLDNLRDSAEQSPFFQEEEPVEAVETVKVTQPKAPFLGMTPAQRLVIAVMLLLMVCVLGSFCLLISEKIVLPF